MGKIGGIIVVSVLALTACSSPAPASEPTVPDPAVPASYDGSYSADEFFIAGVKIGWAGELPTNTQLVELGAQACAGSLPPERPNAARITEYARAVYCP